jgi:O-6-methylguanine DNA methyltransferase
MAETLYIHNFRTGLGWFRVASTKKGVALISFGKDSKRNFDSQARKHFPGFRRVSGGAGNKKAEKQIKAYLNGRLKEFTLPLDIQGTPFQKKALDRVRSIPYGTVRTYGSIAASMGRPGASRAVGKANATNPLPLVIPCHRVVAASGLGGYAGGLRLKKRLLDIEGIKF